MKVLAPFSTYVSPSRTARVCTLARSEPVPGSVMQMPRSISPRIAGGSQRRFCSSVPQVRMYGMQMDEWTAVMMPCARRQASSSMTMTS